MGFWFIFRGLWYCLRCNIHRNCPFDDIRFDFANYTMADVESYIRPLDRTQQRDDIHFSYGLYHGGRLNLYWTEHDRGTTFTSILRIISRRTIPRRTSKAISDITRQRATGPNKGSNNTRWLLLFVVVEHDNGPVDEETEESTRGQSTKRWRR